MHVIEIDGIKIQVEKKQVKNFNLSVKAPYGEVKLTYPCRVSKQDYQRFIYSKLTWIKKQQAKFTNIKIPQPLQYITGEKIWFLGEENKLIVQVATKRHIKKVNNELFLYVLQTDARKNKEQQLHNFYRKKLYDILLPLVKQWEQVMQVNVYETRIRNMKTLWGSCNVNAHRIWLNLQLIKYDLKCIEYVVVHEMVHLLERLHSPRFYQLMDTYLPDWRKRQKLLNQKIN